FLRDHAAIEHYIRASGLAYTFLRPNLFIQGLLGVRDSIVHQGRLFAPIADARISAVDVRDIAAVAAAVLTGTGHGGHVYDLTGPQALTHHAMAAQLAVALQRPVEFCQVAPVTMRQVLVAAGFPAWQADGLVEDYGHYARGEAAEVTATVAEVSGRPAHDFGDFARDYADAFNAVQAG